jgi:hypothetical protein
VNSAITPSKQQIVRATLVDFHGLPLRMPTRFAPRKEFLAWHRQNVFGRGMPCLIVQG